MHIRYWAKTFIFCQTHPRDGNVRWRSSFLSTCLVLITTGFCVCHALVFVLSDVLYMQFSYSMYRLYRATSMQFIAITVFSEMTRSLPCSCLVLCIRAARRRIFTFLRVTDAAVVSGCPLSTDILLFSPAAGVVWLPVYSSTQFLVDVLHLYQPCTIAL